MQLFDDVRGFNNGRIALKMLLCVPHRQNFLGCGAIGFFEGQEKFFRHLNAETDKNEVDSQ